MNKKELNYQKKAVLATILGLKLKNEFKLQAPTGSGKTMVVGMIIENLIKDPLFNSIKKTFVFVAPSTGALDYQGYNKISDYLKKGWLKGFDTHYIGISGGKTKKSQYLENINLFEENVVYFIGWSLFGKNSNLSRIDSEKNNIQKVIQNTQNNNTDIILIVDEAHREVITKSENKEAILQSMNPWKTIEISATLDNNDYSVSLKDVRDEAAIKKNVVVSVGKPEEGEIDTPGEIDDLIKAALKKQKEIKKAYWEYKINDNPLILIQIPDKQRISKNPITQEAIDDYYLDEVKKSLNNQKLRLGYNYALWLSENKTTKDKEELIKMDSPFEVLVFKQAIATGWDIPRANILVRLREPKSPKFDIQTLGRILRNPRFRYYGNHLIDNAFVYTRDKKYYSKIAKEDFVSNLKEKTNVPLSKAGKNSNLSINKIFYSKPLIEEEVIEKSYKKLLDSKIIIVKWLKSIDENIYTISNDKELDAKKILEGKGVEEIIAKTTRNKFLFQDKLNVFSTNLSNNDSLFEIYIKYIALFNIKDINREIMNKFIKLLSDEGTFTKKIIYKKLLTEKALNGRIEEFGSLNLLEYIERIKNGVMKELSEIKIEKYSLFTSFEYAKENIISEQWDKINTYDISFKRNSFDSKHENKIYEIFLNMLRTISTILNYKSKLIHLFRNGINDHSYFIEYYNQFDKKSKFYPDFILIDDIDKTASIIEIKGRNAIGQDIDQKSKYKFDYSWNNENKLSGEYNVKLYKAEEATSINEFNLIDKDQNIITLTDFLNKKISKHLKKYPKFFIDEKNN